MYDVCVHDLIGCAYCHKPAQDVLENRARVTREFWGGVFREQRQERERPAQRPVRVVPVPTTERLIDNTRPDRPWDGFKSRIPTNPHPRHAVIPA